VRVQEGTGTSSLTERIDALFSPWDKEDLPGCALGVMKEGTLLYARGYGMANLEYEVPITPASIVHVASISKQFTAFSVALLARQGRLSHDEDVRMYLPEVPDFGHTITCRHLIHHTSGLRDQWDLLYLAGWREDDDIGDAVGEVLRVAHPHLRAECGTREELHLLTVHRYRRLHPDIVLGPPRPTSPPLLVALPFLLVGQHQQRPQLGTPELLRTAQDRRSLRRTRVRYCGCGRSLTVPDRTRRGWRKESET
jgi:Beta-lactamase